MRHPFILLAALLLTPLAALHAAEAPAAAQPPAVIGKEKRPNVIIINVDNHEKGELGFYGNRFIETPTLDRLFREGLRFENYHISGRCTSSRSELMTGRYHARNGAMGTGGTGAWEQTREGLMTIGNVFSEAGYRTALFGKWHMGDTYPLRPEDRGFEEVVTIHNGGTLGAVVVKPGYNSSPRTAAAYRFRHNGVWTVYEGYFDDTWFSELKRFLTAQQGDSRPFLIYVGTITAHGPHYGPQDLQEKYQRKIRQPEWKDLRKGKKGNQGTSQAYDHAAAIESLDRNVRRMLETLEELKLSGNTVILYTSDGAGGGAASVAKDQRPESTRASDEPFVIRWPALSAMAKTPRTELIANIDLLPTLAEICGIPLKPELRNAIDGQSFASLIGIPQATPWKTRTYIADHQSAGGKDDLDRCLMLFRPLASTQVYLPDGSEVAWKAQKPVGKAVSPQVLVTAKTAYDQWLQHVLQDFPLGAFGRVDAVGKPAYLDAYAIPDGSPGAGTRYYFLLDVGADGPCEISTNVSDRYGAPAGPEKQTDVTLSVSRKTKPGELPVDFDAKRNGYRVLLPEALSEYFETTTQDRQLPATLLLKQGRYLLSLETQSKKPVEHLKVTLQRSNP